MDESKFTSHDRWPIWLWLFLLFLAGSLALAVEAALGNNLALAIMLGQVILIAWASISSTLEISVDDGFLYVGRATIERSFIASVTVLNSEEFSRIRARDANPLCWMAIRFWVPTGVRIEINDPRDPTPYWLVSTKKAAELAAALNT